ncbi:hypothetical protein [Actinomadura nitritigenes]|uniref:hypothetical protein n=1 Tax=Actinomadura nitritigenes TaxID=134602 RepID=UPI003D8A3BAE
MFAGSSASHPLALAAPSSLGLHDLTHSHGLFIAFGILTGLVIVWSAVRDRRRTRKFRAHAAACGWWPLTPDHPVPGPVTSAARSRRTKLAFAAEREYPLWLVWHHWIETSGTGDSRSTKTHDLTRYFLPLGPGFQDVEVVARTALGGFFKPVRGAGTGDPAFDRRFLVRGLGEQQAVRLLTPELRAAMVAGDVPAWQVSARVLISSYSTPPSAETLQPRADALVTVARMLSAPTARG